MERKRFIIITLVFVLFFERQRIFGTEVKIKVKQGDNLTLFCDCVIQAVQMIWIKNGSYGNQSSLLMNVENWFLGFYPRFSFVQNSSSNSYDLHIENVSIYDEGIYYCAKAEKILKDVNGVLVSRMEYQYGNMKTYLTVSDSISAPPNSTHPSIDMKTDWTLWMLPAIVCPVCILFCSICICCLCRKKKNTGSRVETQARNRHEGDDVYYASLNTTSMQKQLKRLPRSDFSIYSEVRTKRT